MPVHDIAELVESIVTQALGTGILAGVDTSNMVSMGQAVLSSQQNTEYFMNTLVQRIGRTIMSYRKYNNKLNDMVLSDFEYGAIVQKLKVSMPETEEDQSYNLTDGQAVDMYKVSKPVVKQKFFASETPRQIKITIQRQALKEAFLSEMAMGGFISSVFGEVQNKIEITLENLGRLCIANFMANGPKTINLLTEYNAGQTNKLTADTALQDEKFLRYAVRRMKYVMDCLTDMRTDFNLEAAERHTPADLQKVRVISDFMYALETTVDYAAFNEGYIKLRPGYQMLNFWQSATSPYAIDIEPATPEGKGEEVQINNIVAAIYDRDAMGIYKMEEEVSTTPYNSAGRYYNTFWHNKELWFNDLGENFVMFTLN